jgi:Mitochondrial ribosomal death-associated protein 3
MLDCVNALYTTTAYHSSDSLPLTSDKFAIVSLFQTVLSKGVKNGAVVVSQDMSKSQAKSLYLENMLEGVEQTNETDPQLVQKTKTSIPKLDAILPASLDPVSHDLYVKQGAKNAPKAPVKYMLPALDVDEVGRMVAMYRSTGILSNGIFA